MMVVPDLIDLRAATIHGPFTCFRFVVLGSTASDERPLAELIGQSVLEVRQRVGRLVGWVDASIGEPLERGEFLLPGDDRLEEVE